MEEIEEVKKEHAKILSVPYEIYEIIYNRGWRDAERERKLKEK